MIIAPNHATFTASSVITLPSLSDTRQLLAAIKAILRGDALAVVSRIDEKVVAKAAAVASEVAVVDYDVAPGFGYQADAKPLFEVRTEKDMQDYLEIGAEYEGRFSSRMRPLPTPTELIEQAIGAALPGGVVRLPLRDRSAPFGLVRHLQPGAQVWPHSDNSDIDHGDVPEFAKARTNLSVLAYLEPSIGGALSIWRRRLTTRDEIDALRVAGHAYALDVSSLPPPVIIRPESGMVVLFDAKRIHSVGPNRGTTPRVSVSGFVLVGDLNTPSFTYY